MNKLEFLSHFYLQKIQVEYKLIQIESSFGIPEFFI